MKKNDEVRALLSENKQAYLAYGRIVGFGDNSVVIEISKIPNNKYFQKGQKVTVETNRIIGVVNNGRRK